MFKSVSHDLYISKSDITNMQNGHYGIGYINKPNNNTEYELISQHAFLPITENEILDNNTIKVLFILK